jgi:hypothetical protein
MLERTRYLDMSNDEKGALAAANRCCHEHRRLTSCVVVEHPVRLTGDQAAHIVRT